MKTQHAIFLTLILLFSNIAGTGAEDSVRSDSCPGALPSRLVNGARGRVLTGAPNRLRAEPDTDSEILSAIPAGGTFTVLEGPRCAENLAWWQVRYQNLIGWTAEGQGENYWVEPSLLPELEPISAANGGRLQPLAMLGVNIISDVAWSPDGKTLLAAGSAGLWRFDLTQPEMPPYLVEGYEGFFHSVAYGPDGKFVVTGSDTGAIRQWDTATWTQTAVLQPSGASVEKLAFSAEGQHLASGSSDGLVQVWDVAAHASVLRSYFNGSLADLKFSPDDMSLVIAHDGNTSIFSLNTRTEIVLAHVWYPNQVAFSPDGSLLVVGTIQFSGDGAGPNIPLLFFDGKTGSLLASFWLRLDTVHSLAFGDNNTLFINGRDATEVWQVDDLLAGDPLSDDQLSSVGYSSENKLLDIDRDKIPHRTLPGGEFFRLNADQAQLAVVNRNEIELVDTQTGNINAVLRLPFFDQYTQGLTRNLVLSPTQPILAFGSGNDVQLVNTDTGIAQAVLSGHELGITALAFSPNGALLASGSGRFPNYGDDYGEDGGVRVWNIPDGTLKTVLHGYTQPILLLRFSADGNILFTSLNYGASGGNAGTWNLATNTLVNLQEHVGFITFSPHSAIGVISSTDYSSSTPMGNLTLWDTQHNLQTELVKEVEGEAGDAVFSPDGQLVVIGNRLWNVETGELVNLDNISFIRFMPPVFSPDGNLLAYSSDDGLILWDWKAGIEKLIIPSDDSYGPVFFTPDGSLIYADHQLWGVQTGALAADLTPPQFYYEGLGEWSPVAAINADGKIIALHYGSGIRLRGVPAHEPN